MCIRDSCWALGGLRSPKSQVQVHPQAVPFRKSTCAVPPALSGRLNAGTGMGSTVTGGQGVLSHPVMVMV